jgi:N-acetylmuramoyl-L-alanine amidase
MTPLPAQEIHCLAQVVHHEARGEPVAGQEAVAQIVVNRKHSGRYPTSICAVVTQKGQFSHFSTKIRPNQASYAVATRVFFQKTLNRVGKRLYFNTIGPKRAIRIGQHRFW